MPPPRVLTAMPAADAALTTAATCSALCGLTTAMATAPGSSEKSSEELSLLDRRLDRRAADDFAQPCDKLGARGIDSFERSAFGHSDSASCRGGGSYAHSGFAKRRLTQRVRGRRRRSIRAALRAGRDWWPSAELRRGVHRARNLESGELRAELAEYCFPVGGNSRRRSPPPALRRAARRECQRRTRAACRSHRGLPARLRPAPCSRRRRG